jgi:hypothetical protein
MSSPLALPTLWSHGSTVILGQVITWSLLDWLVLALPLPERYQMPGIIALASAQYATLAGWLALGDGSVLVRTAFAVHGILWTELINPKDAPFGIAILVAGVFIIVWTMPLAILRVRGWSCCPSGHETSAPLRRLQFGIWHVLVLMTLVGAGLAIWRLIPDQHLIIIPRIIVFALLLGILVWSQWLLLLRPKMAFALGVTVFAALICWGSGEFFILITIGAEGEMIIWTWLIVIHTIIQGLNLLVLRANSYRLQNANARPE